MNSRNINKLLIVLTKQEKNIQSVNTLKIHRKKIIYDKTGEIMRQAKKNPNSLSQKVRIRR